MRKFQTIYLDMDGVLADFHSAALRAHGFSAPVGREDWPCYPSPQELLMVLGIKKEDGWHERFWGPINSVPNFWDTLEPFPWAQELVALCQSYVGPHGVVVLTSPAVSCRGEDCKRKPGWLTRQRLYLEYKFEENKAKHASSSALLIDDWEKQVDPFVEAGGHAVLFPQPWNRNYSHRENPLEYVKTFLENFKR